LLGPSDIIYNLKRGTTQVSIEARRNRRENVVFEEEFGEELKRRYRGVWRVGYRQLYQRWLSGYRKS
jgi:hypothetical protein